MPEDKPKRAIALKYERRKDAAPQVVARGSGLLAEQILAIARANGVSVKEDSLLVEALARLDVGEVIPPDLYYVVAEVFAWLYSLKPEKRSAYEGA